jgi:hypothetical protein
MKAHLIGTLLINILNDEPFVYEVVGSSQIKNSITYRIFNLMTGNERTLKAQELKSYKVVTEKIRDQIMIVNKAERKYKIEKYRLTELLAN